MSRFDAHFEYPAEEYQIVFKSSVNDDEYYGIDVLERKKLRIIQSKYGCRHFFHTLPDKVTLDLHKFTWNDDCNCFEVEKDKVAVQLNTLEEAIVEYHSEKDGIE